MEGFFTKLFRSGLQPVEVGRRIQREMAENRTISVNRVYGPNEFRIFIGPEDNQRFEPIKSGLETEFKEVVMQTAKDNRWNLMGEPSIKFHVVDELGKGEFRVESSMVAGAGAPPPPASTRQAEGDNVGETRALSFDTAERLGLARAAELVVLDQHGRPHERIAITRYPVVIGRQSGCDVVLADPNVSRRHAELRRDGDRWVLVDLGSTNGTYVNGKQEQERSLRDGDRVSFGSSSLLFKSIKRSPDATAAWEGQA